MNHVCMWTPEAEHELDNLPNNFEPLLLQTENEDFIGLLQSKYYRNLCKPLI